MNYFTTLNEINVNDKTEKKNNLTYLAWAWAWAEVKKLFPKSFYTIYENKDGWFYHTDGQTAWVKTGVTIVLENFIIEGEGEETKATVLPDETIEHIEYLPVMDFKNKSIPIGNVTSFDVNKAIQRSLTKAVARHGLGLYIYAGEDLPEGETKPDKKPDKPDTDIPDERVDALMDKADQTKDLPVTPEQLKMLYAVLECKVDGATAKIAKTYEVADLADLTRAEWADAMNRVGKVPNKKKENA